MPGANFVLNIPGLIKSCLLALHLLGLVLGLGAASMLDLIIMRFVGERKITLEYWSVISLLSKSVTSGLVLLWLSGIGFLIHYAFFNPSLLANPKVWAKIAIVGVLSLNGIFIHRVVLPLISQRIGRPMFEGMTSFQRTCLLASGAISGMSWWIPLVLGAFPQLNFTIAAQTILLAYAVLLTFAIISASLVVRYVLPQLATITLPRAEYNALISRLKAQAREARSSAQARNADGIASGIFEQRNNAGNGSTLRKCDSARRNAATRYKSAGIGALRMALPAFAVLGVFAYLSYAFLAPISSLRFDNDAHASVLAEQQHASVGFQIASSAEQLVPEQRSAGEPPAFIHAVAPAAPEPQSEGPILPANAKGNERTPQRQVPTKAGYLVSGVLTRRLARPSLPHPTRHRMNTCLQGSVRTVRRPGILTALSKR